MDIDIDINFICTMFVHGEYISNSCKGKIYKHIKTITILFYIFGVCESGAERCERMARLNEAGVEAVAFFYQAPL